MASLILAIESSCDDTAAAVSRGRKILANVTANQQIHAQYGGVVPELASRAHQQNIIPTVDQAVKLAGISLKDLHAIAYTQGPGLLGSLLVGASFAKSLAMGLNLPLIEVNHMEGHLLAHLIEQDDMENPPWPFLCLTVSGGHTQIVQATAPDQLKIMGQTLDDAAGEAFDKAAKIMGLPYPGGPLIDQLAAEGDPERFDFTIPDIPGLNFSFSGLKTQFLYFLQREMKKDDQFIEENKADICASYQATIVKILLQKFERAAEEAAIKHLALAGGVSANQGLRQALKNRAATKGWEIYLPPMEYCTDNAGMIAIAAHFKYEKQIFANWLSKPEPRLSF